MAYYLIVRGPLGVGKSTVALELGRVLKAEYISIDQILDDHGLWDEGRLSEFLAANVIAAERGAQRLNQGTPVVLDGNFYWKSQIEDLEARLDFPRYVFTLDAPLSVCIARDGQRPSPHGPEAATEVYAKTTAFDYGIVVNADQPVDQVVRTIQSHLPPGAPRRSTT